jgi:UDP-N-acetylmuramyl pentapeptide phosphotransferase/UDP-N-acetylglucosamine-1-phosphate transferase
LLSSFYGFLGVYELSWGASVLVSVFLLVGITNAFNTIDGVDLLATLHGFWVTLLLSIWLMLSLQFNAALISIAISGALAAFVYFNAPPARIFMGDSGTMPTGMAIAMLLLKSVSVAGVYTGAYSLENSPVLAFSLLALPLFDLGRLSILRLHKGHSPFYGDRNHLHHVLQDKGWSHARISYTLNLSGMGIFLIALVLNSWVENINLLMAIIIMLTACVFATLLLSGGKKNLRSVSTPEI